MKNMDTKYFTQDQVRQSNIVIMYKMHFTHISNIRLVFNQVP